MARFAAVALTTVMLGLAAPASAQDDAVGSYRLRVRADAAAPLSDLGRPRRPSGRLPFTADPYALISADELLALLEELAAIGPHLGWRTSTTSGEAAALDWVTRHLAELHFLGLGGLELHREPFRTFTGVEFWETTVTLRRNGVDFVAPADGSPGHRDRIELALTCDSDGVLNDRNRDPVVVNGRVIIVRTAEHISSLTPAQLAGRIVLLDYAAVDRSLMAGSEAIRRATTLLDKHPAAVVMVTAFSNSTGSSHGTFARDVSAFTYADVAHRIPVLSLRMEDLEDFGISSWSDLAAVDRAIVRWDVDLFAPGESSFLVARIPGLDSSRAVILGAHIDSPNTPGALDDGSGAVGLLAVARAIDRARVRPPVDLYLCWFGSHERGLYGSSSFTARHGDILDRAIAMLQMDCLGHPLDGIVNDIWLEQWSYEVWGDDRIPWPGYLFGRGYEHGVTTRLADVHGLVSDNSSFAGYGVPAANMIFANPTQPVEVHYANHLHDPYDSIELARLEGVALADMTTVLLAAALETGADLPDVHVAPPPDRRAVFVGSHTEGVHMSPAGLTELGMALTWEGFDVDMVPYGRAVNATDLADADLVVVLPVHDYPSPGYGDGLYDESWSPAEIDALEAYVAGGGLLVLTNSDHRLKYLNSAWDGNEDWTDVNAVAERFGVRYLAGVIGPATATPVGNHPLVEGVSSLRLIDGNGHRFEAAGGEVIAAASGAAVAAVVAHGTGEVVVLADLGILGANQDPPPNRRFWSNLARYSR